MEDAQVPQITDLAAVTITDILPGRNPTRVLTTCFCGRVFKAMTTAKADKDGIAWAEATHDGLIVNGATVPWASVPFPVSAEAIAAVRDDAATHLGNICPVRYERSGGRHQGPGMTQQAQAEASRK